MTEDDRAESGVADKAESSVAGSADDGIETTSDEAVEEIVDQLPDDLQPALANQDEYEFPNNSRRRIPGYIYLASAAGLLGLYLVRGEGILVNKGLIGAAIGLAVLGVYSIVAGRSLDVDERDALVASINEIGFPVGHASAQMGWRGLLSRPTWRVLLYSAEDQPTKRALVLVDGVDGSIVDTLVEDNPEDWSKLDV